MKNSEVDPYKYAELITIIILQKCTSNSIEERWLFQKAVVEQLGIHREKNESHP